MLPLMLITSNVQNNECSKYLDNHLKPKLLIHSTRLACFLHYNILAFKYLEYLDYDVASGAWITQKKKKVLEQNHLCVQIL